MVLKRKQYHGFNGINLTSFPRGPRSSRGKGRRGDDSQICAFELLASLAGKLLQESEGSSASSNASEANYQHVVGHEVFNHDHDEGRPVKCEFNDKRSYVEPEFSTLKKDGKSESDSILERSSVITNEILEKPNSDVKPVIHKNKTVFENSPVKVEGHSPEFGDATGCPVENAYSKEHIENGPATGGLTVSNPFGQKDPMELCTEFPVMINLDNDVKLQSRRGIVSNASFMRHRNYVKQLCIRDDDEKLSRFNKPLRKPKSFTSASCIGDRRLRKILTSKYWKPAPKLKDYEVSKVGILDGGKKSFCRKRKLSYRCDRYRHDTLYKRRKFSDHSLVVTSDGGFSSESVCNSPEKGISGDKNEPTALFNGANATTSSAIGHQKTFLTKDSHVKFSIKSFRTPELLIEVPETATVGSLKRTVMEAVTALLGNGLRIGVLLHGKKVRDDHRTLSQSGITSKENLSTLGFSLEPSAVQTPSPVCIEDPPAPLQTDTSQLVTRSPAPSVLDPGVCDAITDPTLPTCSENNIECNHGPVSSHGDIATDTTLLDSRALVLVPSSVNEEALAVVPVNQKPKRSDLVQRRTRRPFSVSEVEALVQAVEELGTGRWRDVKLCSFEDADHRTYVDLKDKWKTLVHTAKIAPQQRRGEPVPQDLLDRVLAAHAYWSQHQPKQHNRNESGVLKISDAASVLVDIEEKELEETRKKAKCTKFSNLCNILTLPRFIASSTLQRMTFVNDSME